MYRTIFWKFSAEYSACDFLEKRLKKGEKNGLQLFTTFLQLLPRIRRNGRTVYEI
jgi:hypothetical protein